MTGQQKIDTTSINAKLFKWFCVYKDEMKVRV